MNVKHMNQVKRKIIMQQVIIEDNREDDLQSMFLTFI